MELCLYITTNALTISEGLGNGAASLTQQGMEVYGGDQAIKNDIHVTIICSVLLLSLVQQMPTWVCINRTLLIQDNEVHT